MVEGWSDQWWWNAHSAIANVTIKARKSSSDSDSSSSSDSDADNKHVDAIKRVPTDEELFKACGGRRLGMRARASQAGKWKRAEEGVLEPTPRPDADASIDATVCDNTRNEKKQSKKAKKEKKVKKEKKAKKETREAPA